MKVCIDPGHGMGNVTPGKYDPGCTHGTLTEAEIALQWGLTLKHVLIGMGHEVFMTRDDATDYTPVGRRDDMAEAAKCDVFLSVHVNAAGILANGVETFHPHGRRSIFAEGVHKRLVQATKLRDRGLKDEEQSHHEKLAVFGFDPKNRAALIEVGFIGSARDRSAMLDRNVRVKFAELFGEFLKGLQ
jgi:N-acetylmuramoyl-L-alanine amidase